ncbi:hypothetical protein [unidentified bacterial endosymbiont]|uniref:hypothetical protein n=1 Tax=unidentified bacterial endosymbiont TaxID=2355 RepID=UPI00209CF168|nr:hypothetical protein [unidentified bacterial endosymbiont]
MTTTIGLQSTSSPRNTEHASSSRITSQNKNDHPQATNNIGMTVRKYDCKARSPVLTQGFSIELKNAVSGVISDKGRNQINNPDFADNLTTAVTRNFEGIGSNLANKPANMEAVTNNVINNLGDSPELTSHSVQILASAFADGGGTTNASKEISRQNGGVRSKPAGDTANAVASQTGSEIPKGPGYVKKIAEDLKKAGLFASTVNSEPKAAAKESESKPTKSLADRPLPEIPKSAKDQRSTSDASAQKERELDDEIERILKAQTMFEISKKLYESGQADGINVMKNDAPESQTPKEVQETIRFFNEQLVNHDVDIATSSQYQHAEQDTSYLLTRPDNLNEVRVNDETSQLGQAQLENVRALTSGNGGYLPGGLDVDSDSLDSDSDSDSLDGNMGHVSGNGEVGNSSNEGEVANITDDQNVDSSTQTATAKSVEAKEAKHTHRMSDSMFLAIFGLVSVVTGALVSALGAILKQDGGSTETDASEQLSDLPAELDDAIDSLEQDAAAEAKMSEALDKLADKCDNSAEKMNQFADMLNNENEKISQDVAQKAYDAKLAAAEAEAYKDPNNQQMTIDDSGNVISNGQLTEAAKAECEIEAKVAAAQAEKITEKALNNTAQRINTRAGEISQAGNTLHKLSADASAYSQNAEAVSEKLGTVKESVQNYINEQTTVTQPGISQSAFIGMETFGAISMAVSVPLFAKLALNTRHNKQAEKLAKAQAEQVENAEVVHAEQGSDAEATQAAQVGDVEAVDETADPDALRTPDVQNARAGQDADSVIDFPQLPPVDDMLGEEDNSSVRPQRTAALA